MILKGPTTHISGFRAFRAPRNVSNWPDEAELNLVASCCCDSGKNISFPVAIRPEVITYRRDRGHPAGSTTIGGDQAGSGLPEVQTPSGLAGLGCRPEYRC